MTFDRACGPSLATSAATPTPAATARSAGPPRDRDAARAGSPTQARRRGLAVETDRNGNLWAWWRPDGVRRDAGRSSPAATWTRCPTAARSTARWASCRRSPPSTSLRAAASSPRGRSPSSLFADEEGARFGVACLGLAAGHRGVDAGRGALALRDGDGVTLAEAHDARRAGDPRRRSGRPDLPTRRRRLRRAARRAGPRLAGRCGPSRSAVGVGDLAARALAVRVLRRGPTTPAPRGWRTGATRC